jgi:hypothetical protein
MPQSWDMGQIILLPLRRKACCGFFQPEKSDGFAGREPAILGTRGQHANHYTTEAAIICGKYTHVFNCKKQNILLVQSHAKEVFKIVFEI